MEGYTYEYDKRDLNDLAFARVEGVDASYKDLTQVCGRIRGKQVGWAFDFLQKAAEGDIPILYKKFNTRLGHRRELGGSKGRYPKKAAAVILKALKSAAANARVKGLSDDLTIVHISANKKTSLPRMQPKGRRFRADYTLSRIEIIVKGKQVAGKKVQAKALEKKQEPETEKKPLQSQQIQKNEPKKIDPTDISVKKDNPAQKTENEGKNEKAAQPKQQNLNEEKKEQKKPSEIKKPEPKKEARKAVDLSGVKKENKK